MVVLTLIVFLQGNTSGVPSVSQQITPSMKVCRDAEKIAREELAKFNTDRWFVLESGIQSSCTPL